MLDLVIRAAAVVDGTGAPPVVAVLMGSSSDMAVMKGAAEMLERFGVPHEMLVVSAHRLATVLAGPDHGDHTSDTVGEDGDRVVDEDRPVPTGPVAGSYRRYRRIRQLRHPVRRRPVDGGGGQATKAAVAPWSDGEPTVHRDDGGPEAAAGREIPAQDGSVPAPQEATL